MRFVFPSHLIQKTTLEVFWFPRSVLRVRNRHIDIRVLTKLKKHNPSVFPPTFLVKNRFDFSGNRQNLKNKRRSGKLIFLYFVGTYKVRKNDCGKRKMIVVFLYCVGTLKFARTTAQTVIISWLAQLV